MESSRALSEPLNSRKRTRHEQVTDDQYHYGAANPDSPYPTQMPNTTSSEMYTQHKPTFPPPLFNEPSLHQEQPLPAQPWLQHSLPLDPQMTDTYTLCYYTWRHVENLVAKDDFDGSYQRVMKEAMFNSGKVPHLEATVKSLQEQIDKMTADFNYRIDLSEKRMQGMEERILESTVEDEDRFDKIEERLVALEGEGDEDEDEDRFDKMEERLVALEGEGDGED